MFQPQANQAHLTLTQVKQIINETFIKQSFKKHMDNLVLRNASRKVSPESVKYANKVMQKLVYGSTLRPSNHLTEKEEFCFRPTTDIIRVKMIKKNMLRNSSIDMTTCQQTLGQISLDLIKNKDLCVQGEQTKHLKIPLSIRGESRTSHFSQIRRPSKMINHHRKSTQQNPQPQQTSLSSRKPEQLLLPISTAQQSTGRSTSMQSHLNQKLEHHIESLRNRKLKLEAAFINFDTRANQPADQKLKENLNVDKKNPAQAKAKRQQDGQFKVIVTDYDGEVLNSLPAQKMKKINMLNKENYFNSGSFAPTVRIKTEVSSNFFDPQQSSRFINPTKGSTRKKFTQSAFLSSMPPSNSANGTSNCPSICSMQQLQKRIGDSRGKNRQQQKQVKNELTTKKGFAKSKKIVERK